MPQVVKTGGGKSKPRRGGQPPDSLFKHLADALGASDIFLLSYHLASPFCGAFFILVARREVKSHVRAQAPAMTLVGAERSLS